MRTQTGGEKKTEYSKGAWKKKKSGQHDILSSFHKALSNNVLKSMCVLSNRAWASSENLASSRCMFEHAIRTQLTCKRRLWHHLVASSYFLSKTFLPLWNKTLFMVITVCWLCCWPKQTCWHCSPYANKLLQIDNNEKNWSCPWPNLDTCITKVINLSPWWCMWILPNHELSKHVNAKHC